MHAPLAHPALAAGAQSDAWVNGGLLAIALLAFVALVLAALAGIVQNFGEPRASRAPGPAPADRAVRRSPTDDAAPQLGGRG